MTMMPKRAGSRGFTLVELTIALLLMAGMAAVLFGEVLDGEEAARLGLAYRCVENDQLLPAAQTIAGRAASAPRARNSRAAATVGASGSPKFSAATFEPTVRFGVSGVDRPMMPIRAPPTLTMMEGLAHDGE